MRWTLVAAYRFADVELDLDRFTVTRAGRRLALEPKAIELLRCLVERPGRLVGKDELLDAVWPGVAVTPNVLTRLVAQLRRELGDDAAAAHIIETVPTRGYRFIAAVAPGLDTLDSPATPAVETPLPAIPDVVPRYRRWRWAAAAGIVVAAVVAAAWMARHQFGPAIPALRPLGGEPGSILDVAFSPNGRWLALSSDRSGDYEIYLRDLDQPQSRPLTADGQRNVHPAWSPDSTRVAFHSNRRHGIWVMDVAGGAARQVAAQGSKPAWSPDGRWIAFQTDEWVVEFVQPGSHLQIVPADGSAPPRALTRAGDPPGGHGAPRWSPDGSLVYFEAQRNGTVPRDIWSVRVRDGLLTQQSATMPPYVIGVEHGPSGVTALAVERPSAGRRLVRVGLGSAPATEVVLDDLPRPVRSASFAPGGRLAALVLAEVRSEVWTVPVTAAGAPTGPAQRLAAGGHPAISPDGRRVAYDLGREIRVRSIDGGGERTVIEGDGLALYPSWGSDRRLFALRADGLTPYLVEADLETGTVTERLRLPQSAAFARVGPDGDSVIATLGDPLYQLARGSLSAGSIAPWPELAGYSFGVWSPDGRWLAAERKVGPSMPMYLIDLRTAEGRPVSPPDGQFWPGAFSPEGTRIAMSVMSERGTWDVEVLDLASGTRTSVTREITPPASSRYPSWSPQGGLIAFDRFSVTGSVYLADVPARP